MIFAAIATFVSVSVSDTVRNLLTSEEDDDHGDGDQDLKLSMSKAFGQRSAEDFTHCGADPYEAGDLVRPHGRSLERDVPKHLRPDDSLRVVHAGFERYEK